jgi:hypothetical protein
MMTERQLTILLFAFLCGARNVIPVRKSYALTLTDMYTPGTLDSVAPPVRP